MLGRFLAYTCDILSTMDLILKFFINGQLKSIDVFVDITKSCVFKKTIRTRKL